MFLLRRDLIYYNDGESRFEDRLFSRPILKPHRDPPPPRDTLNKTGQLLPHPFLNYPPLPPPLTHRFLPFITVPCHDPAPPSAPSTFRSAGRGELEKKRYNLRRSRYAFSVFLFSRMCIERPIAFLCVCFAKHTNIEAQKRDRLLIYFLLTIDNSVSPN